MNIPSSIGNFLGNISRLFTRRRGMYWFRSVSPGIEADRVILREGGYFDAQFYLEAYPDVADAGADPAEHYLRVGYREGRIPSALFDQEAYLAENEDVRISGVNPLIHWLRHGAREARKSPFRPRQGSTMQMTDEAFLTSVFYPHITPPFLNNANLIHRPKT